MTQIFETVILLSLTGSISVIILLLLKLFVLKRFSGMAQKILWILALLSMVIPVWKFIPEDSIEPIIIPYYSDYIPEEEIIEFPMGENTFDAPTAPETPQKTPANINYKLIIATAWLCGAGLFMAVTVLSYISFLIKKKKNSIKSTENAIFEEVKDSLKIKHKIRVRKCKDSDSPFLTGVFFPIVYTPENTMDEEAEKLIYLHELTHYKNCDLILKWVAFFVNAVHWFNPLCYIITKNINEACEIACDMSVTKNMDDDEKKLYMSTILNLVSKKG